MRSRIVDHAPSMRIATSDAMTTPASINRPRSSRRRRGRDWKRRVTLRPTFTLAAGADRAKAEALVGKAHEQCFISSSVTTRLTIEPRFA